MKLLKKQITLLFLIGLFSFSALIAVFSLSSVKKTALNEKTFYSMNEQADSVDYSNQGILSNAIEPHQWYDKALDDIKKIKGTPESDFSIATKTQTKVIHPNWINPTKDLNLEVQVVGDIHSSSGSLGGDSSTSKLKYLGIHLNDGNTTVASKASTIDNKVSIKSSWGRGNEGHSTFTHSFKLSVPEGKKFNKIGFDLDSECTDGASDYGATWAISRYVLEDGDGKTLATYNWRPHYLNAHGSFGNSIRDAINANTFAYTDNTDSVYKWNTFSPTWYTKPYDITTTNDAATKFSVEDITLPTQYIDSHTFTEDELKAMFHLKESGTAVDNSKIEFSNISLDKQNSKIVASISCINTSSTKRVLPEGNGAPTTHALAKDGTKDPWNDVRPVSSVFKVSARVVSVEMNGIAKASSMSGSYWEHLSTGENRFHTTKPSTKLVISENYLKSLYIYTSKEELLKKVESDSWGFVGTDKQLVIDKIKAYAINVANYDETESYYENSHDRQYINNLNEDAELKEINVSHHFDLQDRTDILRFLSKNNIQFKYGAKSFKAASISFAEFNKKAEVELSDEDVRDLGESRTTWNMIIKDLAVGTMTPASGLIFDKSGADFKPLFDVDFDYNQTNTRELVHTYLCQFKGINIANKVSFILEDGTILDQDYKVVTESQTSTLKLGDYGYVGVRYLYKKANGSEEYITLQNKSGTWYSPKYKKNAVDLITDFDENKIQHLFNQDVQIVINPYDSSIQKITPSTHQSFALSKVFDNIGGNKVTLEDWEDGKWSHSTSSTGNSLIDGIFGADTNGFFDERGHLEDGIHDISLKLKFADPSSKTKTHFAIVIDTDPVKVKVKSTTKPVSEHTIEVGNDKLPLYYSSGPIHFEVDDIDISSVQATLIDQQGNWYSIPIQIKSIESRGQWTQVIDSTIDFAGLAKVQIKDRSGNSKELYFWLKQDDEDPLSLPQLLSAGPSEKTTADYMGTQVHIFDSVPKLQITSPLISSMSIIQHKLVKGVDTPSDVTKQVVTDTKTLLTSSTHGKTIDSSKSVLKFAGDELKPFALTQVGTIPKWDVLRKDINFTENGLYEVILRSKVLDEPTKKVYYLVNDGAVTLYDVSTFTKEQANFKPLPTHDGGEMTGIDKEVDSTPKLFSNLFSFEIQDMKASYSQLWYSDWSEVTFDSLLSREGKYKIDVTDIYGSHHVYQILVLDKSINSDTRTKSGLPQIYKDESKLDTAFWNGKNIWNYWRYEDADHAKWEHDNFIDAAIKAGLTPDQAEILFKHMKENSNWNGDVGSLNAGGFNFKHQYQEYTKQHHNISTNSSKSKGGMIAGIVGGTIFGIVLTIGVVLGIIRRAKTSKIK